MEPSVVITLYNVLSEHRNGFFLGGWIHIFNFLETDFVPVSLASRIPLLTIFVRVMCHGSFTTVEDGKWRMLNGERRIRVNIKTLKWGISKIRNLVPGLLEHQKASSPRCIVSDSRCH